MTRTQVIARNNDQLLAGFVTESLGETDLVVAHAVTLSAKVKALMGTFPTSRFLNLGQTAPAWRIHEQMWC